MGALTYESRNSTNEGTLSLNDGMDNLGVLKGYLNNLELPSSKQVKESPFMSIPLFSPTKHIDGNQSSGVDDVDSEEGGPTFYFRLPSGQYVEEPVDNRSAHLRVSEQLSDGSSSSVQSLVMDEEDFTRGEVSSSSQSDGRSEVQWRLLVEELKLASLENAKLRGQLEEAYSEVENLKKEVVEGRIERHQIDAMAWAAEAKELVNLSLRRQLQIVKQQASDWKDQAGALDQKVIQLTREVEEASARSQAVEEAEERLALEMGELEAEGMEQVEAFREEVTQLQEKLAMAEETSDLLREQNRQLLKERKALLEEARRAEPLALSPPTRSPIFRDVKPANYASNSLFSWGKSLTDNSQSLTQSGVLQSSSSTSSMEST